MRWQAWARGGGWGWEVGECVCVHVRENLVALYFFHMVYSQEGFYALIFSLKNNNWIMKYSFK